jgi:cytochrome b
MLIRTIVVWDLPTRIFKWSLVLAVGLAFLFSSSHPRGSLFLFHVACGYTVTLLLLFRLVWGFIGGRYARFRSFVYGWRGVSRYAQGLLRLDPPRTVGHNPVGGLMIMTMLATLSVIVVTGLLAESKTGGAGRLSGLLSHGSVVILGDIHAWLGFFIIWLAGLHVAGVLFESLLHRENLVRSMVTGRKKTADPNDRDGKASPWRAAPLLVLLAILGAWLTAGTHLPPR